MTADPFPPATTVNHLYCCKCNQRVDVMADVPMKKYCHCPLCRGIAINHRVNQLNHELSVKELANLFEDIFS